MSSQMSPPGVAEAIRLQQAGDLDAARDVCLQLLKGDAEHADALHVLGVVEMQARNLGEAVRHLEQVSTLAPQRAAVWNHLGAAYAELERPDDSLAAFRRALELEPDSADTHYNLGTALRRLERNTEAINSLRRAVELKPRFAEAHYNLANELRDQELFDEAAEAMRQAIAIRPGYEKARKNLAKILQRLATRAQDDGDREAALKCFREIIELLDGFDTAHAQLGFAKAALVQHEAAIEHYRRALVDDEDKADVHVNLGASLHHLGRFAEAEAAYAEAIRIQPEMAGGHYNYAESLLSQGKFEPGWREYEWRFQLKKDGETEEGKHAAAYPAWDGSSLDGKTILLQSEQGLGDTLQFIRYGRLLQEQGARVIARCPRLLQPILSSYEGVDELVPMDATPAGVNCQVMMLSAPLHLGTHEQCIPADVPYLRAAAGLVQYWRQRLEKHPGRKIGIVWRGSSLHKGDWLRSIPLEQFAALAEIDNVCLVSLQKADKQGELPDFVRRYNVLDFGEELDVQPGPFMDTAAIIENLDLVICCDTSVGHLAGALGAEVWLALPTACDWRWMRNREDSPWYPHHRLFRQTNTGDWDSVFRTMTGALRERLANGRPAAEKSPMLQTVKAHAPRQVAAHAASAEVASIQQAAHEAFRNRDFKRAEEILLGVIAVHPSADAYNQLGAAQGAQRNYLAAERSFERAVALAPQSAEAHLNLGAVQRRHQRFDAAAASLRTALQLQPNLMPAKVELGDVLQKQGRSEDAVTVLMSANTESLSAEKRRKLATILRRLGDGLTRQQRHEQAEQVLRRSDKVLPQRPETVARLASSLASQGRHDEAVVQFHRTLELRSDFLEATINLGASLKALNRDDEAEAAYRRALELSPDSAEAHCNLCSLLMGAKRHEEAIEHGRRAVGLNSDLSEAQINLGSALVAAERYDEARNVYQDALRRSPRNAELLSNLALLKQSVGDFSEALRCHDLAVEAEPDNARSRAARAMALLCEGDFERGWPEYEWRFQCEDFGLKEPRWPRWKGEAVAGKTILLWSEQGLGDTLQFVRYAALLKERGARVVLECVPPLARILRGYTAIDVVLPRGETRPAFDLFAPLMSLPGTFKTGLDSVPAPIPYLHADEQLVERWGSELDRGRRGRIRIGICWRGQPKNAGDARRSFPLTEFEPIAQVPGVELISLQKQVGEAELDELGGRFHVRRLPDLDEQSGPFMDTAAVLQNVDLLISCDSSVAHLSGAMGVPVWMPLPFAAEWRWLRDRSDSPWYPRHRLFRQERSGEWQGVFHAIAAELGKKLP